MHCKTGTILLRIRVRGHFVMSLTKNLIMSQCLTTLNPIRKEMIKKDGMMLNAPVREIM